jgi:oxygen-dependent protoporphyrinogen oxidase
MTEAMNGNVKRVVVLGGGISGLSSAFYLAKASAEKGEKLHITVVEKGERFGGKIQTSRRDGLILEKGPDSFLARKMPIIDLTRELGLEEQLVTTNSQAKKTYILHRGRLHRMPPGLVLGIPTQLAPFMKTGLISPAGKARAAMDLLLPRRNSDSDESLGGFLQRRLGKEVLSRIAEPLLAGIYAGDTFQLSLQSTFPQFQALERKHRSLIVGLLASRKQAAHVPGLPALARNSLFLTYRNGLTTLVDALLNAISEYDVSTVLRCNAVSITNGEHAPYEIRFTDGEPIEADGIIVALPSYAASRLLPHIPAVQRLGDMPYVSVANAVMAFNRNEIVHSLDGSGFVVPREEGRFITACTWTSSKWPHTSPDGKALLRCYVGRSGQEEHLNMSDEEIVDKALADLKDIMNISFRPYYSEVNRWPHSMPQYPVGHLTRVRDAREQLAARMPGVMVTGAAYHGVGIPDCIRQGKESAESMLGFFEKTRFASV